MLANRQSFGVLVLLALLTACGEALPPGPQPPPPPGPPGPPSSQGLTIALGTPAGEVRQGGSLQLSASATRQGGSAAVTFQIRSLPAGVSLGSSTTIPTATGATLAATLTASQAALIGTHRIQVVATAGASAQAVAEFPLTVQPQPYLTLRFDHCFPGYRQALWAATRDGTGPWLRASVAGSEVRIPITSSTASYVAVVERIDLTIPSTYDLRLHTATASELASAPVSVCPTPGINPNQKMMVTARVSPTRQFLLTVAGASSAQHVDYAGHASHQYSLPLHESVGDIVGSAFVPGFTYPRAERVVVRRDVPLIPGSSVGPVGVDGVDAFPVIQMPVTVNGTGSGELSVASALWTAGRCHNGWIESRVPVPAVTSIGVPSAAALRAGDLISIHASQSSGDATTGRISRSAISISATTDGRSLTLPGPLTNVQAHALPGVGRRLRASFDTPAGLDGERWLGWSLGRARVLVSATKAATGSGTVVLEMPDLSGVDGWQEAWLHPGVPLGTWYVRAHGGLDLGDDCTPGTRQGSSINYFF